MKAWAALALIAAGSTHATTFFEPCEAALQTPPFKALQAFYATKPELPKPDACFRLNNREFLVTVVDAGYPDQGLYLLDATTGSYQFPDGASRAGLGIKLEFDGPGHKHFALLQTTSLGRGESFNGYTVLYLQPRADNRSFVIQQLLDTQADPEVGLCGSSLNQGRAAEVKGIRTESDAQHPLTLVMQLDEQACPSGPVHRVDKRFDWNGQRFQPR